MKMQNRNEIIQMKENGETCSGITQNQRNLASI